MTATKRNSIPALISLNAVLLVLLGLVVLTPGAKGQGGQGAGSAPGQDRARGTYTMVGGKMIGSPEAAIYVVDAANQELVAAKWDRSRKALKFLGYHALQARRTGPANPSEPGR